MSDLEERIARFENMAQADPDNDMAHFSLANAYLQAERFAEAATSFQRCLELNADMSKAYQLAGEAMIKAGWTDQAARTLEAGYRVAAGKGDLMPKNAIVELLASIGREPPELPAEVEDRARQAAEGGAFVCARTGRPGTQLPDPPMRGPVGQWIYENISAETWRDWLGQGTKVINELRLDLSREADQKVYDEHMCEYLGIDPALQKELTGKA
ncbi:MAG: Fe(2+)-trafficking protein [Planctomycetota bacterium]|nr:Fe(2+)-trafficking protein [Planctomycetota bacterium]